MPEANGLPHGPPSHEEHPPAEGLQVPSFPGTLLEVESLAMPDCVSAQRLLQRSYVVDCIDQRVGMHDGVLRLQDSPSDIAPSPSQPEPDAPPGDDAGVQLQSRAEEHAAGGGAKLSKAQRQRLRKKLREAGH